MQIGKFDVLAVLAITAAGRLIFYLFGVRFDASTLAEYMQFIDKELLTNHLMESLWFYHANPPLLNLYTGIILKTFGQNSEIVFSLSFHALGFAFALAIFALAAKLIESRRAAYILTTLIVFSPAFILYENWLMYTFPTAALLVLSTYALLRYVETEAIGRGLVFFSCIATIALTRSMFHLVWVIAITGGLILAMKHDAKRILLCAAVPLVLVLGWYGKNYYLFGNFSASTWTGLGLSNITTLTVSRQDLAPLVEDGTLSKYALVSRYEDKRLLFDDIGTPAETIPILHHVTKSTGGLNFNYAGLIEINKYYTRDALQVIRHFPSDYASGVVIANRVFFSPSSMNYFFNRENRDAAAPVEKLYNPLIYGAGLLPDVIAQPHYGDYKYRLEINTGVIIVVTFPLVLIFGLIRLRKMFRSTAPHSRANAVVLGYLLFNILYIYFVGTLLELSENNRYRFIQEPLVVVVIGLLLSDFIRTLRKRPEQVQTPR